MDTASFNDTPPMNYLLQELHILNVNLNSEFPNVCHYKNSQNLKDF